VLRLQIFKRARESLNLISAFPIGDSGSPYNFFSKGSQILA